MKNIDDDITNRKKEMIDILEVLIDKYEDGSPVKELAKEVLGMIDK